MARLIERLIDSDVKAQLLMLLHSNPSMGATLEELAARIGKEPRQIKKDIDDFVRLGLLKQRKYYEFNHEKDLEIQKAISIQLAGEFPEAELEIYDQRISTGIPFIDELLSGGIPSSSTVMIIADPGTGREMLTYEMTIETLEKNKRVTYVTFDDFPDRIRDAISKLKPYTEEKDEFDKLTFIDYYSKLVGAQSTERYSGDPSNLMEQVIMITQLIPDEGGLLVLDSATTLFQSVGIKSSMELLRRVIARTRKSKANFLINLTRGAFHPAIIAATQDLADGVIEMTTEETKDTLKNKLRIIKMKHTRYNTIWVFYEFTPNSGLELAN